MTTAADDATLHAAVEAARRLELALHYAGISFELEGGTAPRSCRLRLSPSAVHPWTLGDVQGHLLLDGIIAEAVRIEQPLPCPGLELLITLPSAQDVRALGRLVEACLTEVQSAALQLHRALARAGIERRPGVATVGDRPRIDIGMLSTEEALLLFRGLGGGEPTLHDLDLGDWHDHERFVRELQRVLTATGQVLLVESVPTCGHCRVRHGGNRIRLDYLDADDALVLATELCRVSAPRLSRTLL
ncbi:hypothetical protein [Streptomyces sp. NPDC055992]|uniref:hypothetical protein n=1 Tax=Streptomyces sp. NPDC055992 TaxID=3345673 RepID=UPI0035DAB5FB